MMDIKPEHVQHSDSLRVIPHDRVKQAIALLKFFEAVEHGTAIESVRREDRR